MKVFKFGGASVKDAAGIRNLAKIVLLEQEKLVVVVSAFGKTTNALERVLKAWLSGDEQYIELLNEIYVSHISVINNLSMTRSEARSKIDVSFALLRDFLLAPVKGKYDFNYDQIVSYGEIWSTLIVSEYLKENFGDVDWCDIRENIKTDDRFRDANVLWSESTIRVRSLFNFVKTRIYVTQGFIGGTLSGYTTTLGREGSDYTAAILANILDAEYVVVWKDVPGILNADPKWFSDARKLDEISYKEAVEMSFLRGKSYSP
jgi:aspartate kinase